MRLAFVKPAHSSHSYSDQTAPWKSAARRVLLPSVSVLGAEGNRVGGLHTKEAHEHVSFCLLFSFLDLPLTVETQGRDDTWLDRSGHA